MNPEIIESFAIAENMAANRVYGDLYRDYGPSRDPTTNHYVPTQTWPWPRLPPFLGPSFLLFSTDTLPRLLQVLPQVPPFPLWEVWLSGLVAIKAEVLRIGVKDFFGLISRKVGISDFFDKGPLLPLLIFRRLLVLGCILVPSLVSLGLQKRSFSTQNF